MQNRVFRRKDGIVEIVYRGCQDYASVHLVYEAAEKFYRAQKGKKLLKIFVNLEKVADLNNGTLVSALKALRTDIYEKMAIIKSSVPHRTLAEFLIKVADKEDSVQFFDNEESALRWLRERRKMAISAPLDLQTHLG